jgi:uncharacterized RDD family membrane protein YckC
MAMKTITKKRICAYLIDMFILFVFIGIGAMLTNVTENEKALRLELSEMNEKAVMRETSITSYLFHLSEISQDIDREHVAVGFINLVFVFIYFVFIPYFMEGKTFGKALMKIRVVDESGGEATIHSLVIRNVVLNGLLYLFLSLLFIYIVPGILYLLMISILGIIQLALVIFSIFMVLYRKDGVGLHERLSHTRVVEV